MKTKLFQTDKIKYFQDKNKQVHQRPINELINPHRRIITYICKNLNISRHTLKKLMKQNKEFRDEINKQITIEFEKYGIKNNAW